jgi:sugar phosphate permease
MNPSRYPVWAELAVLTAAFALSHAFRTVVTLVAMSLRSELALGNETIGLVGAFHITFGVMQLPMGLALDLYGPRRVVAVVFPVAVGGAILTVLSSSFSRLSTVARGILRTCAIVLARTGEHIRVRKRRKSQWFGRSRYRCV